MSYRNDLLPADLLAVVPTDDAVVNLVGVRNGDTTAGDITVYTAGGGTTARLIKNIQPGETVACTITQVRATGTTVTLVTGFKA